MTRLEHLKKLPLQKRLQALENIRKYNEGNFISSLNKEVGQCYVLGGSFIFEDTRQRHDYWMHINYKYFDLFAV